MSTLSRMSSPILLPTLFVILLLIASSFTACGEKANVQSEQSVGSGMEVPEILEELPIEEQPKVIGGIAAISDRVVYQESQKRDEIEGIVQVNALINEKGKVEKAEIKSSLNKDCDEAAMKAVYETKFIPAQQSGKPVKSRMTVPVRFYVGPR